MVLRTQIRYGQPLFGTNKVYREGLQLREPLSIFIKYKTTVTPKINILISSSFPDND